MRRDEFLKKRKAEEANKIPKDILYEVANQWSAAGFKHDELLDENNNWYLEEKDWYEAERENKAFSDMQEFCMNKLNYCINAKKRRWYNRSEAAGFLFEQYLFNSVKQDKAVQKNNVVFTNENGRTFKNAQVFDGWKDSTKNEKRRLFIRAVAATIMNVVWRQWYAKLEEKDFSEWFLDKCNCDFVLRQKTKPHPYMIFGDTPGQSKHYKLTRVADKNGIPTYECQATLDRERERWGQERSGKFKRFISEAFAYAAFILIFSLFIYAILAIIM